MFECSGKNTDVHMAVLIDCLENYTSKHTRQLMSLEKKFQEHNHSIFLSVAIKIKLYSFKH